MPYIKKERRLEVTYSTPQNSGELNFLFSLIAQKYWKENSNYKGINDIVGALEGAKLEFYRRIAVPYEDKKIVENGDVY